MKDWLDLKIAFLKMRKYPFWDIIKKLKEDGITIDKYVLLKRIKNGNTL